MRRTQIYGGAKGDPWQIHAWWLREGRPHAVDAMKLFTILNFLLVFFFCGPGVLTPIFDLPGIMILIPPTLVAAAFAPLVFLGGFWPALIGSAVWGLGMGVHESIIPAVVAPMVSPDRRAAAYGLFTAGYGIFWFLGSAVMGIL